MFHKKQMLKELQLSQKIYNSYVVQYTMEDWNKGQGCWGGPQRKPGGQNAPGMPSGRTLCNGYRKGTS